MKIPVSSSNYVEVIKKSRFLVKVFPLPDPEAFDGLLKENTDLSANHNCWAWKAGNRYRFSDDGEPGGTAGRPILQAIESQGFDFVAVLVIRYFGGIKLGTGGLIRAYGGTASRALQEAPAEIPLDLVSSAVTVSHEYTGTMYRLLKKFDIKDEVLLHGETTVTFRIQLLRDRVEEFHSACSDATGGKAVF